MSEFAAVVNASYSCLGEVTAAQYRETEAFIAQQVDALVTLVESAGDARSNGGWSWS